MLKQKNKLLVVFVTIILLMGISACSSGGSEDDGDTRGGSTNRTPTASAGSDQTASVNTQINLGVAG